MSSKAARKPAPKKRWQELLPIRNPRLCNHGMRFLDNSSAHWRCVMCLTELPGAEYQ